MKVRFTLALCFFLVVILLIPSFAANDVFSSSNQSREKISDFGKIADEIASSVSKSQNGGCYIENGQLVVCIKGSNQINLNNLDRIATESISIRNVQYSIAELEAVVDVLIPNMDRLKIATLDADETKNKICIELYEENDDIYDFIESNHLLSPEAFQISTLEGEVRSTVLRVSLDDVSLSQRSLDSVTRSSQTIYPGSQIMCGSINNIVYATAGPRINNTSFYTAGHIAQSAVVTHLYGYASGPSGILTEMGTLSSHTFGSGGDYGTISVVPFYVSLPSSNTFMFGTGKYSITHSAITGTEVEMWGGFSGISAGKITATNVTVRLDDGTTVKKLCKTSYTCKVGDSGGGVFTKNASSNASALCYGVQSIGVFQTGSSVSIYSYFSLLP